MNKTLGLEAGSPWTKVVRRPPAATILEYVHRQWLAYAADCTAQGVCLQARKEPELTTALQAFLQMAELRGEQPFDGDFFAESQTFDLDRATGKSICVARTDLDWICYGFPRFTIEFKLLDGSPTLRTRYWRDGLTKFIASIYAARSDEAAMWGFLRTGGHADGPRVAMLLSKRAINLACATPATPLQQPSVLSAGLGLFDSAHLRSNGPSPLLIAHLFVPLP